MQRSCILLLRMAEPNLVAALRDENFKLRLPHQTRHWMLGVAWKAAVLSGSLWLALDYFQKSKWARDGHRFYIADHFKTAAAGIGGWSVLMAVVAQLQMGF